MPFVRAMAPLREEKSFKSKMMSKRFGGGNETQIGNSKKKSSKDMWEEEEVTTELKSSSP